ncbi:MULTISPECIES: molybdopterin-synthase adenylyltransferase MoeB [Nocardiaceae]|uniref:Adenylyltransferase/sulfurtransferase n=1 Tax=Rhodococcoides corynebacterioides TaxID=53972 RepID=A0ABS2KQR6_9NOCA|nr:MULTISPECIES: molybdopterin-synthase adenylyltransferase MoeB [Rhodococcus]MBM7414325.1 adenylyltransferase/sulfurtransferase [Rhodococcus corynebacterioides]MBP1116788.1 adenylyltransferase/sulfurtransferase [Rhodococcus sp. PvP016]
MTIVDPVVEPGPELSREQVARYSRHLLLPDVGVLGQRRLRNARVLVIGAGGLGSPVLLYLASAGVGTLGIVEFDDVDASNLQRQVIHGEADIGRPKSVSARESIRAVDSTIEVRLHQVRLEPRNAVNLFRQYDLVVDGTDNFATRYLVNDAAAVAGIPYVWGSIYRFDGQVSVFWDAAPGGLGVDYRDLYPDPPAPGTVPSCSEAGVLGVLCGVVGSIMATEAVKLVTGMGDTLLGRLLVYDARTMTFRTVTLRRDPGRVRVSEVEEDYEVSCGVASPLPSVDSVDGDLDPTSLRALLDGDTPVALIDVRDPVEWDIVHLDGATLMPLPTVLAGDAVASLPTDRPVVLYCKTGVRSAEALAVLRAAGIADVHHLRGGLEAWARDVDPTVPTY